MLDSSTHRRNLHQIRPTTPDWTCLLFPVPNCQTCVKGVQTCLLVLVEYIFVAVLAVSRQAA